MKKIITQAFLVSAIAADASVDTQVSQIMNSINFEDIEKSIKADLIKDLENKAIQDQIKVEVEKRVLELKNKEDSAW